MKRKREVYTRDVSNDCRLVALVVIRSIVAVERYCKEVGER